MRRSLASTAFPAYPCAMTLPYHTPLSPQQQADAGIARPQPLAMADQVRFSELDVLNHVNNKAYFEWFERSRIRYTQDWSISGLDDSAGPRIVIRSGMIRYLEEMHLNDDYIVTCGCTAYRTASFTLCQQVWAAGSMRASFDCVMVLLQQDGSGRYPIPAPLRHRFDAIDTAVFEG